MSIATRTGDNGTTGLMYNRRAPKTHPRIEAIGTVDELNVAIGMARALAGLGLEVLRHHRRGAGGGIGRGRGRLGVHQAADVNGRG